jgi:NADH-quinone oxidoreductase subunit G
VIDICPVGALTDRDFRFQVRVWYLDTTKSVCDGCARGCNVEIHTSRRRPHHNQGKRVARIKPRFNGDVNKWWICDAGRYGFGWIDDASRLLAPAKRDGDRALGTTWDDAIAALAAALRGCRPEEIGVVASPRMANEDLWALKRLVDHLGIQSVDYRVPPPTAGDEDDFLIRADKNPNSRGAELCGLAGGGADALGIVGAARERRLKLLWVFHHDLDAAAIGDVETLVFQGPTANAASARAHLVLPSAAYAEREGTFTNFAGRVQRFRTALDPLGEARPDWQILGAVGRALGLADAAFAAERAEQVFLSLAAGVPAYAGMSYRALGDGGLAVKR